MLEANRFESNNCTMENSFNNYELNRRIQKNDFIDRFWEIFYEYKKKTIMFHVFLRATSYI